MLICCLNWKENRYSGMNNSFDGDLLCFNEWSQLIFTVERKAYSIINGFPIFEVLTLYFNSSEGSAKRIFFSRKKVSIENYVAIFESLFVPTDDLKQCLISFWANCRALKFCQSSLLIKNDSVSEWTICLIVETLKSRLTEDLVKLSSLNFVRVETKLFESKFCSSFVRCLGFWQHCRT